MVEKHYFRALTIAGSDSGGGAGIQADLKTFGALGVYGTSVITALTAQNTERVKSIFGVSPSFVADQLESVFSDIGTDTVKIGMLHDAEIVAVVARALEKYKPGWIVLDPVMIAKSGDKLIRADAVKALKETLIPLCHVLTPNLPEAEILLGENISTRLRMEAAARKLLKLGSRGVVIKGGHLPTGESPDCLYHRIAGKPLGPLWLESKRIETKNTHGTGCTFSSAIAAFLARGHELEEAVKKAKRYIHGALISGRDYEMGRGHGPLHHFWKNW